MSEYYNYPIVIKKEEESFLIRVPDFPEIVTESETEEDIISEAQDALALCIIHNEDSGIENPSPSKISEIPVEDGEKIVYVQIWTPYFRRKIKEIYVKKTLTIPQWLDTLAKENNLNFSSILVKGLKEALGI